MQYGWFLAIWPIIFNLVASDPVTNKIGYKSLVTLTTTPSPTPTIIPLQLYKTPLSPIAQHYEQIANKDTREAKIIEKISQQPYTLWASSPNDIAGIAKHIQRAKSLGVVPVVVAYFIPYRNCDLTNTEGAKSPQDYNIFADKLIDSFSNSLAILVVEPDAIAGWDCLDQNKKGQRRELLASLLEKAKKNPYIRVYVDIGHPRWLDVSEAVNRLKSVGADRARGFSLNVANFISTGDVVRYGRQISRQLGNTRFVVDTSRNGVGPTSDFQWCNPRGRTVGEPPRLFEDGGLDGYLWIKPPGESDGNCNGGPKAGDLWIEYALELGQNL